MRNLKRRLLKSINKKLAFLAVPFVVCLIYIFMFHADKDVTKQSIGIGVADDMSGFVIDYIVKEKKQELNSEIKPFLIRDC